MKKNLLFLAATMLLFIVNCYSQVTMSTGGISVNISQYGRIRILTPDAKRQIERASILVGTSATEVFDYTNDAEPVDAPVLVASPTMSDFEIYGSIDRGTATTHPNVLVKYNAYGWTNGAYTIVKFNIKNAETSAVNALIGLDIIPYINYVYGFDTITYNSTQGVIRFHRGLTTNAGVKLLSAPLYSLYSFEWYDGYAVDADYYTWMTKGTLQPRYVSTTADGPVTITSQPSAAISPGASVTLFYAIAVGTNEQTMLNNIAAAQQKFDILTTSMKDNPLSDFGLKNYPNPVNASTTISYQLPADGNISLKIYNALGIEKDALVNSNQTRGLHTVNFDAKDLPAGVYTYRLAFNNQVISNKMLLVK